MIDEEVCSAAAARSSELRDTFLMDCPISSMAAAFSAMLVARSSVSRLTDLTEAVTSSMAVRISCPEVAISCGAARDGLNGGGQFFD